MSNDMQIQFKMNNQNYEVNLSLQKEGAKDTVCVDGRSYVLKGEGEAIKLVKKCLGELPPDSNETMLQTAKELKGRLWLAGAKNIELSTGDVHKIGLKNLANRDMDIPKAIDEVCVLLEKHYIFPEVAKKCSDYLQQQLRGGAYDSISDHETLEQAITSDIRLISNDKHVFFECKLVADAWIPPAAVEHYPIPKLTHVSAYNESLGLITSPEEDSVSSAIGFSGSTTGSNEDSEGKSVTEEVIKADSLVSYEIKSGLLEQDPKVGYIDMRTFGRIEPSDDLKEQQDVAARRQGIIDVVKNIKEAESVIIDLRNNKGGDPFAVQLMCSLFTDENFPLNQLVRHVN